MDGALTVLSTQEIENEGSTVSRLMNQMELDTEMSPGYLLLDVNTLMERMMTQDRKTVCLVEDEEATELWNTGMFEFTPAFMEDGNVVFWVYPTQDYSNIVEQLLTWCEFYITGHLRIGAVS